MEGASARSYAVIKRADLRRLGELAAADREKFYLGRPEYRDRLLCVALCQGAGQHYVDIMGGATDPNGVKDFDVYSFFADIPGQTFPAPRRYMHADFGLSKFGCEIEPPPKSQDYVGRRVDFLMRGLRVSVDDDPMLAVRAYLEAGRTDTSRLLARKGVVVIEPALLLGKVAWAPKGAATRRR